MGDHVVWAVLLGFAYFVLLLAVAMERPRPGGRGGHRRDLPEGAW